MKETGKTAMGFFVETVNDLQSSRLMKFTKIGLIDIGIEPHSTLNSKRVVECRDLLNCTKEEIDE